MRKKYFLALATLVVIAAFVPTRALACGGFVSLKGTNMYHSIYCDLVEGCRLDDLRWYDTSKQAEAAGLMPCDECNEYSDWDYSCEYYEPHWKTDNHLLWSAMEMEHDLGLDLGNENGYAEGFADGQTGYEYASDDYYEMGYNKGYEIGKERGYDYGYDEGRKQAQYDADRQRETAKKESKKSLWDSFNGIAWFAIIVFFLWNIGRIIIELIKSRRS